MTVMTHSTWKILYTKNKCAQHAYTPAYVGVKQIEKLDALDSHTTMIIVHDFIVGKCVFNTKYPYFALFLEIFIFFTKRTKSFLAQVQLSFEFTKKNTVYEWLQWILDISFQFWKKTFFFRNNSCLKFIFVFFLDFLVIFTNFNPL